MAPLALRSANLEEAGDPICDMFLVFSISTQTHEIQESGVKTHSETKWNKCLNYFSTDLSASDVLSVGFCEG
jgi:hypothetical protein